MWFVSLKPTATAKQSIIRTQFNSGTYIRPLIHLDVCRILTRGKQPNAWLWLTNEHAADIAVSLATIAAKTAMAKNGQNKGSNKIWKKHSLETKNKNLCSSIKNDGSGTPTRCCDKINLLVLGATYQISLRLAWRREFQRQVAHTTQIITQLKIS